jgi:hypothetical protein
MSSPSDTTPLSPQKAIPVPTTELALSLSSEGHSLDLCAQMSTSACPVHCHQLRALRGSRLISLLINPVLQQDGQPRARRRNGPADVDRAVLRVVAAAATPPPILLLAVALAS